MQGLKQALIDIWRLAVPYFKARDIGELRIWSLATLRMQERWIGIGLALALILINLGQVGLSVRLNFFSRDLFNALQDKNAADFWHQLLFVFSPLAAVFVASYVLEVVVQYWLEIRWRRWLTTRYISRWLDSNAHYRMQLIGAAADNPDQRIAEDIRDFVLRTRSLSVQLLTQTATLVSFVTILWTLSRDFTLPGTDIPVPGMLLWVALAYAAFGTWITHIIGKPLVTLFFAQQRYEADFRYALVRVREYGEQIALLDGSKAEEERLQGRFNSVVGNFLAITDRTKKLTAFTQSYLQANVVVPYLFTAPYYFIGKITLGQMQQTVGAFFRIDTALTFFVTAYQTLADYKAIVDRLTSFDKAIAASRELDAKPPRIEVAPQPGDSLHIADLALRLPQGNTIVTVPELSLAAGETALVTGPSGSGKSTLLRAIAGIWPFGQGSIAVPEGRSVMLLPQRPYLPAGTLRGAVTYPGTVGAYTDEAIRAALAAARLPQLVDKLDEDSFWAQRLSLGEQQRLAVARALLAKPDWLFLDEATAALDEPLEEAIYGVIAAHLPDTTVVSIGHRSTLVAFHRRRIAMQRDAAGVSTPRDAKAAVPA